MRSRSDEVGGGGEGGGEEGAGDAVGQAVHASRYSVLKPITGLELHTPSA